MPAPMTLPARIKGVIFDCDGVIIDSKHANALYYNKILQAFGLAPLTEEQLAYTFMSTVPQALEYIIPKHLQPQLPEVRAKAVSYQRDIMPSVELNPSFQEFSSWLQQNNIKRAVHTNRSNGMQYVVDKFTFLNEFDPIITASTVQPKPHPEGIFKILEAWNLDPTDIIFVGDSKNDQDAAAAAGVAFVSYGHEKLESALAVTCYTTLQKLLGAHIST